ncbi:hypothetical protein DERP_000673, partial [Dermatophagoides pteronyssinus]
MCTKNCCVLIVLLFIIPLIFWNLSSYVNKKFYSCFSTRENLKYSSLKLLLLYHDKTTKTKEYYHLHLILNDTLFIFETEFRICEQTKSKTIHWCYIYLNKLISTEKWNVDTKYRIDETKLGKINQLKLENIFKPNDQLLIYRFRINVTTSISVIRKRYTKKYQNLFNRRPTSSKPDSIFIEWVIEIYTQMSKSIMELSEKDRDQDQDHDHDYDHDQDHDHDHDNDDHDHDHKINSTKFCSGHIPFGYVHRSFVHVWCVADFTILIFPYGQQKQMKKQEPDLSIKISIDHYIICPLQSYSSILLFLNEDYI